MAKGGLEDGMCGKGVAVEIDGLTAIVTETGVVVHDFKARQVLVTDPYRGWVLKGANGDDMRLKAPGASPKLLNVASSFKPREIIFTTRQGICQDGDCEQCLSDPNRVPACGDDSRGRRTSRGGGVESWY